MFRIVSGRSKLSGQTMGYARALIFTLLLPLLAACSGVGWPSASSGGGGSASGSSATVAAADTVTLRLAEAAEKAATALNNISSVEQARTGQLPVDDYSMAPPELMEPVTITWVGPAEQFLQMAAARAGYQFSVVGARPGAVVTVTIDEYQQPLIKLIKSAALQVTGRADVILDASQRVLEVRYAPNDAE
jgi:hypothetical protein